MEVKVNKQFLKDLAKITDPPKQKIEKLIFEECGKYKSLEETGIFTKLKGYKNFYRAKFGVYRVGVRYSESIIISEIIAPSLAQ